MKACLVLLLALSAAAVVSARVFHEDVAPVARQLQQIIDTSNARCPDGCESGYCQADATTAGLRCVKCAGSLIVKLTNGRCSCPRGKYSTGDWNNGNPQCIDCPKGSYCAGGDFVLGQSSSIEACPADMTTIGKRTESARGCVNLPGFSYNIDSTTGNVSATVCPVNTYSSGLKKQRACVPCPTGYVTDGTLGRTKPTDCYVPEGYFLKAPGQVAPCPKGEWKSTLGASGNCTKCAFGVTTVQEGSISEDNCTMVVAGRYATAMTGAVIAATQICPQKYYCPGGTPYAQIADETDFLALNATLESTIALCGSGLWTQDLGSISVDQCLTPPGFKTSGSSTTQCLAGEYRADWKPANQATNCLSCGVGVFADTTDRLKVFDLVDPTNVTYLSITTSADDCYIKAGTGLYYSTITGSWRARNCDTDNYGVLNTTYGLSPMACKDCPNGMVTRDDNTNYPNSTQYWYDNADGLSMGFISALACVTVDGWGYNGRVAQKCDTGSYNSKDTRTTCTKCGYGLTTEGVGKGFTSTDCGIAAGFGWHNVSLTETLVPCPIGYYNDIPWNTVLIAPCTQCPAGLTTEKEGSDSPLQCNMCLPGFGGTDCADTCGGIGVNATYGPAGRGADNTTSACVSCSMAGIGFSFEYNLTNMVYAPRPVSRDGANFSGDCLTEFTQMVDGAWYIPVDPASPAGVIAETNHQNVSTFEDCLDLCDTDDCMFVSYNYDTPGKCLVYNQDDSTANDNTFWTAWKSGPSGDTAVNAFAKKNFRRNQAKAVSSGMYSWFHDVNYADYGTQADVSPAVYTAQECLNACDDDTTCAGIRYLTGFVPGVDPSECKLIKGDASLGVFTRTMLRTALSRLTKPVHVGNV